VVALLIIPMLKWVQLNKRTDPVLDKRETPKPTKALGRFFRLFRTFYLIRRITGSINVS